MKKKFNFLKHLFISLLFFNFFFTVYSQKTTITGKSEKGMFTMAYLLKNQQSTIALDSAKVDANGNFKLSLSITNPDFFVLQMISDGEKSTISMILFPKQSISVELVKLPTSIAYKSVKGSDELQQIKEVFDILDATNPDLARLTEEYKTATEKTRIEREYNQMVTRLFAKINTKLLAKKELLANAMLVSILDFNSFFTTYKIIAQTLSAKYPLNSTVQNIVQQVAIAGATQIGAEAPEIELPDNDGNMIKLSSLRGKYVLIDFWASWCGPCRKENPHVVAVYKKFNPRGFEIYSVSLDKDKNAWQNAIKADNLIWKNHVSDLGGWGSSAAALYGVRGIPYTVLIDKGGKILNIGLRGDALTQKLLEIFGE